MLYRLYFSDKYNKSFNKNALYLLYILLYIYNEYNQDFKINNELNNFFDKSLKNTFI